MNNAQPPHNEVPEPIERDDGEEVLTTKKKKWETLDRMDSIMYMHRIRFEDEFKRFGPLIYPTIS